jgi:hypothetical protein
MENKTGKESFLECTQIPNVVFAPMTSSGGHDFIMLAQTIMDNGTFIVPPHKFAHPLR